MLEDVVITLISFNRSKDLDGYEVKEEKQSTIFGKLKSVRQSEFYQALQSGIRPTKVAVIYVDEYRDAYFNNNAPEFAVINGFSYRIVREYQTDEAVTELTLTLEVHGND